MSITQWTGNFDAENTVTAAITVKMFSLFCHNPEVIKTSGTPTEYICASWDGADMFPLLRALYQVRNQAAFIQDCKGRRGNSEVQISPLPIEISIHGRELPRNQLC